MRSLIFVCLLFLFGCAANTKPDLSLTPQRVEGQSDINNGIRYQLDGVDLDVPTTAKMRFLDVSNALGDIVIRSWNKPMVALRANEQRIGEKPSAAAQYAVSVRGDTLFVQPKYQDSARQSAAKRGQHTDGRVDLVLAVPRAWAIHLSTFDGRIRVLNHRGSVWARSTSGDLVIHSRSGIVARSDTGEVSVEFRSKRWQGDSDLQTSKNILVAFRSWQNIGLDLRAAGGVERYDYSGGAAIDPTWQQSAAKGYPTVKGRGGSKILVVPYSSEVAAPKPN
jgi:hypothetical protein